MKPPLFVREPTPEEHQALEDALRSGVGFTLRRAPIVRLSAHGQRPSRIAESLGCCVQTVRNAIHAFNTHGGESFTPERSGPKDPERIFDHDTGEALLEMAHQCPRHFGKQRSSWTLALLAEVAFEEGLTEHEVSYETIRQAIHALGGSWQRAKDWIESPDLQYALKKNKEIA